MEQIQRRYVKFKSDTLNIVSIGFDLREEEGFSVLPIDDFKLVEPFFKLEKNPSEYYPLIVKGKITGFRRREMFESQVVLNTEDSIIRSLRSFENFITKSKIAVSLKDSILTLIYDKNYFDSIAHQENIDRLSLAKERVYNLYVTRKGDPFEIFKSFEITLEPFITTGNIQLPYSGPSDISVYVVTKD